MRKLALPFSCFVLIVLATAVPAHAAQHFMVIDEIYPGHPGAPDAQYVMLRMTSGGQTNIGDHSITSFSADGTPQPVFGTFGSDVLNGTSGSRILMATQEAVDLFGISADHVTTGRLEFPSGRICFSSETIDCVAYGDFTGNNGIYGPSTVALERGLSLHRTQDSQNNAADLELRPAVPINNSGGVGGADDDGDRVPDFSDCAPSDPLTWFAPPEVVGVSSILDAAGAALVNWDSLDEMAGPSILYDLVLGSTSSLQATGGFLEGVVCGGKDLLVTSVSDSAPVTPGDSRTFVIRGKNGCGVGTYGRGFGTLDPDPRSLLDDPLNDPCR